MLVDQITEVVADRYRAPALDKGLDILELLAAIEEPMSQAEIAKALGRTPNEIYRMLDRLVRRHYIVRTAGERYELTLKLFALAHQHAPMRRLISQALPELRAFSRAAGQACHVAVYRHGEVVVVEQVDAPGYWGFAVRVGSRIDLFNTGSGHVLLAFATDQERALMIEEHDSLPHEEQPADLERRLAEVRARGFEQMPSRQTVGVQNLSVPILGPRATVVAALTCPFVMRKDGIGAPGEAEAIAMLREAAGRIMPSAGG